MHPDAFLQQVSTDFNALSEALALKSGQNHPSTNKQKSENSVLMGASYFADHHEDYLYSAHNLGPNCLPWLERKINAGS